MNPFMRLLQNRFSNPTDESPEHEKWRRAVKAAEKKIRVLAASGEGEVNKNREAAGRAIEKVYHWERFIDDPEEKKISDQLSRLAREAEEEARRNLAEARNAELARLRREAGELERAHAVRAGPRAHAARSQASMNPFMRLLQNPISTRISDVDPSTMQASAINRELDRLDKMSAKITDEFIAAGRGYETASETWKLSDPLALRYKAVALRQDALRNEISRRYGPRAPSRLPRGFGPIRANPVPSLTERQSAARVRELKRRGCYGGTRTLPDGTRVVLRKKGCMVR